MSKAFMRMCVVLGTLVMVGCSAGDGGVIGLDETRSVTDGSVPGNVWDLPEAELVADKSGYIATSGKLEYDSSIIEVWYSPEFEMPAELPGSQMTGPDSAAAQPNSILRLNSEYEALTDALAQHYGMSIRRQVYWRMVNFATFDLPLGADGPAILAELGNGYPGMVESVSFAGLANPAWEPDDPDYHNMNEYGGVLWGMKNINCAPAWDYTRGERSVRVGVVDSGIRLTHEELTGVVLTPAELAGEIPEGWSLDIANGDNTVDDLSGHGTMCAGAVGAANNGNTIIGVAPNVSILPIKIHDTGSFPWTDGYAGITLAHLLGADIISCSWGHSGGFNNQERTIIEQVTDGGSLVIAAAGNDNTTASHYPSDFTQVVCVGANDPWDVRCDFSNYGDPVDISAPGQWMKRAKHTGDSAYDKNGGGTSYACPMVSGAAALLLSAAPGLTNNEIRELLETTGDPVTGGFPDHVKRLNIGNAMAATTAIHLELPPAPLQLVHQGVLTLVPVVGGEVDNVDCYLNGTLYSTLVAAPWEFEIDTSNISFGFAIIEFRACKDSETVSETMKLLIDNSTGAFPLLEGFEETGRDFMPLQHQDYDPAVLQQLRAYGVMGEYWTPEDLRANGAGVWSDETAGAFEGYNSKRFGNIEAGYDAFEADTLISKLVDLTTEAAPTLVFHQHYNIQRGTKIYDRAWVMVTTDYGQTFSPAKLSNGDDALFSGFSESWEKVEIDLSEYSGSLVHVALVFESGRQNAGNNAEFPPGWWVDDFTIATDYQEHLPSIGAVNVAPYSTYGDIIELNQIDVGISEPDNVARVEFILEYYPAGSATPEQIKIDTSSQPFEAVVSIPMDIRNQLANLLVHYYSDGETSGTGRTIPVYIFNQLGDTNADGSVDQADIDGYQGKIGLTQLDPGYIPFFDSDLDGTISEYDAAVVGYHWGE